MWPVYANSIDHFNDWLKGINYQTHRGTQTFLVSLTVFFKADPILFIAGTCGSVMDYPFPGDTLLHRMGLALSLHPVISSILYCRSKIVSRNTK